MKRPTRSSGRKKLGIIVCAFFGFILLSSTILFAVPSPTPSGMEAPAPDQITITGTPQDNYPDAQRAQFCGVAPPQSNTYIREFEIPTECTQPLAIVTAPDGGVWFAQSNTGNLARFDATTETFTEFSNPLWESGQRSMIWGLDYADGYLWYGDEANDSVWRFDTATETYRQFPLPGSGSIFPQVLQVVDTDIILNDLTGNTMVVLDASDIESGLEYYSVPSNVTDAVTAGFTLDRQGIAWYTTWIPQGGGLLVGLDPEIIKRQDGPDPVITTLPPALRTPNGIAVDHGGNVWLADTSSSYFFMYDAATGDFSQFVTSTPDVFSYGNVTGIVGNPISRPYWMQVNDNGMIVFNQQTANRIGVMDPRTESLVEYSIPSRNPLWSDCGGDPLCGISQALTFTVDGSDVWLTQWAENNVAVLDTSIPLPFDITLETPRVQLSPGETVITSYVVEANVGRTIAIEPIQTYTHSFLYSQTHDPLQLYRLDGTQTITLDITSLPNAVPGEYKILLGAKSGDVTISKFVTVDIVSP